MRSWEGRSCLLISLFLLAAQLKCCSSEELLELACQDAEQCQQFALPGVAVRCEEGRCRCSNNSRDATGHDQRIECRPKDHVKSNIIGGACPCTMRAAECHSEENVCYCALQYVASADRRRCIKRAVELGAECETNAQCAAQDVYAVCGKAEHRCECGPGFARHNGSCLARVGFAANCTTDAQCHAYGQRAFCSTKQCLCPSEYISRADKSDCIEVADHGAACTEATHCFRRLGSGATCRAGVCRCAEGHFRHEELLIPTRRITCKPIAELGSYCHSDEDCYQHHLARSAQSMRCLYGECNCRVGYNSVNRVNCTADEDAGVDAPGSSSSSNLHYQLTIVLMTVGSRFVL